MTIRFIDDDQGLKNIVSLSKDLNEILREEVLKQSLMRANVDVVEAKRKELWLQILKVDKNFITGEYDLYYN